MTESRTSKLAPVVGMVVVGSLACGFAALVAGIVALSRGDLGAGAFCFGAGGISFGLLAGALLRG